jgi:formylmethanofuran dehydrogenase subunit D
LKCLERNGEVIRVSNEEADEKVGRGWVFVPKRIWKETVKKETTGA